MVKNDISLTNCLLCIFSNLLNSWCRIRVEHDFAALKTIREYNKNETIDEIIKMYI